MINFDNRRFRIWEKKFIIEFNRKTNQTLIKYIFKIYQYLINKREGVSINHFNDPKAFIEYSNDMRDVYKNIDEYNPYKENKILIVFDDMITDMIHNKKLNSIVTELFIRGRKLNISLVLITQLHFKVPKDVTLNASHLCIAKIPN